MLHCHLRSQARGDRATAGPGLRDKRKMVEEQMKKVLEESRGVGGFGSNLPAGGLMTVPSATSAASSTTTATRHERHGHAARVLIDLRHLETPSAGHRTAIRLEYRVDDAPREPARSVARRVKDAFKAPRHGLRPAAAEPPAICGPVLELSGAGPIHRVQAARRAQACTRPASP